MHALAGHRPLPSSLSGHSLLWRIARPLPISRLLAISMLPAQLVDSFGGSQEHSLGFERSLADLGANVSVTASFLPSLGLMHSIQVAPAQAWPGLFVIPFFLRLNVRAATEHNSPQCFLV